jgi:molecular chaperone GrpE
MVSFRKEKKRERMAEQKGSAEADASASAASQADEIRVTDKRRFYNSETEANGEASNENAASTAPNLKPSYVAQLEARAEAAEQKLFEVQARFEQARTQLQRETDETRQRLNRAADERARTAKVEFIAALLPVLDNLQRAIAAADAGGSTEALMSGVRGTASSFENALLTAGAEPIASVGETFDPEFHDAVETVEVEPERDGKVIAEFGRGYKLGDRLLRPARVQVGRARSGAKSVA